MQRDPNTNSRPNNGTSRKRVSKRRVSRTSNEGSGPTFQKPKSSSWGDSSPRTARQTRTSGNSHQGSRGSASASSQRTRATNQPIREGRHSQQAATRSSQPRIQGNSRQGLRTNAPTQQNANSFGEQQLSVNIWSKDAPSGNNVNARNRKQASNPIAGFFLAIIGFFMFIGQSIANLFKGAGNHPLLRVAGIVLVAVLLVGAIDTGICWGKIYNGVYLDDIELSGMSVEDATTVIDKEFSQRLNESSVTICKTEKVLDKILAGKKVENIEASETVSVKEANKKQKFWTTDATSLQARMDAEAMAKKCLEVGRSDGGIFKRLGAQLFGCHVTATCDMNDSAVESLAKDIDKTMGDPRKNFSVKITNGKAKVVNGHDGNMVSREWLKDQLFKALLEADSTHAFVAEISYAPLQITEEQATNCAQLINDNIKNGCTLTFENDTWDVSKVRLGKWTKVKEVETSAEDTPEANKTFELQAYIDQEKAKRSALSHLGPAFDSKGSHIEFKSSKDRKKVTVKPNATGTMPILSDAIEQLDEHLFHSDDSSKPVIEVPGTEIPESMSFEDALDYGIIEKISSYTTEYTTDAKNRNTNIHLAADLLNNSVVKAKGGIWSFHETAGECNAEKGFVGAGVIVNGETVDEIGGGICQVATTAFNAVYEAGYPVVTRWNHSLYIMSYPAGRDAAVSWPDLDLRWKNDTKNDILMRTSWTKSTVTISLYGINPGYQVESETGDWKQGKKYETIVKKDPTLPKGTEKVAQNGWDGSSITVVRTVKSSSGKLLHKDVFNSKYDPRDEVILKGTKTS